MHWSYMLIILFVITWIYYTCKKKSVKTAIPGPKGIPFWGNLLQLKSTCTHLQFTDWAEKYGSVFSLNLGGHLAVVVSSHEAIYETLVTRGNDFAGRIQTFRTQLLAEDMAFCDPSPVMKHQKKLIMNHMKIFRLRVKNVKSAIMKEVNDMVRTLKELSGSGENILKIDDHINHCIIRMFSLLAYGYILDDRDIQVLNDSNLDFLKANSPDFKGNLLDNFPLLRHLGHPYWKLLVKSCDGFTCVYERLKEKIYKDRMDSKDLNGSFLHIYLKEYESDNVLNLTEKDLIMTNALLFGASITNITSVLSTLFANLISHPSIQAKLHDESDCYLNGRQVTLEDRSHMPYHQAAILEIIRLCPSGPLLVPHKALCDSQIKGYQVPKDTAIFVNIWALQHDPKLWENPYTFNPNRFIDEHGQLVTPDHPARVNLLPFGIGPRVCAGQMLALNKMFLIVAVIVQNFELLPASTIEKQPPCGCLDMVDGFSLCPLPYTVRIKSRN